MLRPDKTKLDQLRRIASLLLDEGTPAHMLRPEILEMMELLQVPVDPQGDISNGETRTAGGLALSPTMAAMCAGDYVRTIQFIRGTHTAIADVRKQFPDRPARVLYVGCGPIAPLALPLMAVHLEAEARFTLLDLHAESIESAKSIVGALRLAEHVTCFETMDATAYRIDPENPPDIILMEIMQACLEAEPQVAIARHLLPQAPSAIVVPEEVCIGLALVDPSHEFVLGDAKADENSRERKRTPVGAVFALNRECVDAWENNSTSRLPASTVRIPESMEPQFQPMLFTRIRVYKNHVLKNYDSGLTCPKSLPTQTEIKPGDTLRFHYELGSRPRLRCRICKPPRREPH